MNPVKAIREAKPESPGRLEERELTAARWEQTQQNTGYLRGRVS